MNKAKNDYEPEDSRNWRTVPGYSRYQASLMGEVRSFWTRWGKGDAPHDLNPYLKPTGRRRVIVIHMIDDSGKVKELTMLKVMRLAWFSNPPAPGMILHHKNADLWDNSVNNLEWIDRSSLGKRTGAESNRRPVVKVNKHGFPLGFYSSAREAARENYISYQAVMDRCNGKIKKPFALDGCSYVWDE